MQESVGQQERGEIPEGCALVDYSVPWQVRYQRLTGHNTFRISEWPSEELTEDQKLRAVLAAGEEG